MNFNCCHRICVGLGNRFSRHRLKFRITMHKCIYRILTEALFEDEPEKIRKVYPNFFYDKVKIRIFFSTRWDRLINCFEREYFSIQILVIGRFAVIFGRNGLLNQRPTTSKIVVLIDLLQLISTNCEICKKNIEKRQIY